MSDRVSAKSESINMINSLMPHIKIITDSSNLPSSDMNWRYVKWLRSANKIHTDLKMWKLKFASDLEMSRPKMAKPLNQAYDAMNSAMRSFKKFEDTKWTGDLEGWRAFWNQLTEELSEASNLAAVKISEASQHIKIDYFSQEYREEALKKFKEQL